MNAHEVVHVSVCKSPFVRVRDLLGHASWWWDDMNWLEYGSWYGRCSVRHSFSLAHKSTPIILFAVALRTGRPRSRIHADKLSTHRTGSIARPAVSD